MRSTTVLEPPVLCIITDDAAADDTILATTEAACAAAKVTVQLRVRNRSGARAYALATSLREITRRNASLLIVNDRLDIALAVGADGVHLPAHGLHPEQVRKVLNARATKPSLRIGVSVHSTAEIERLGAFVDYVHFGPVFETPEKARFGDPLGLTSLREAAEAARAVRLIAVGGVDATNVEAIFEAGADSVAVIRAVAAAADPGAAARQIAAALQAAWRRRV